MNDHPFFNGFGAGNHGFILALDLDKTETARGRGLCFFLDGTEVGYVDAILQRCPEEFFSFFGPYDFAING